MPCQAGPSINEKEEKESRQVCFFIVYLWNKTQPNNEPFPPSWVLSGAGSPRGDIYRHDEATALLCRLCREASDDIIYNPQDKISRELASWWEDHQELDKENKFTHDVYEAVYNHYKHHIEDLKLQLKRLTQFGTQESCVTTKSIETVINDLQRLMTTYKKSET